MMCDQEIPNSLWEEASYTIVYVQKRCPHAILEEKTPENVFSSEKSHIKHLRIFRCFVYIHVKKKIRTKIEPSRKKETFVFYSETSKYYGIYVLG